MPSVPMQLTPVAGDRATIEAVGRILDGLGIGLLHLDAALRTLVWNRTFLRLFPEHAGLIHAGEPYRRNLERFYGVRLGHEELPHLADYVEAGVARHCSQTRPFRFEHRGRTLLAHSQPLPDGSRLRLWQAQDGTPAMAGSAVAGPMDLFAYMADGATLLDSQGRILAVNQEFLDLYDLFSAELAVGRTFRDIVRGAWGGDGAPARMAGVPLDDPRFAGAAYEVELPGDRWRRVIERRLPDGTACLSHADISTLKRQQRALQEAYREIERMAATDALTAIANRRHFERRLAEEVRRGARETLPVALLLIDIDHFKRVNDRFGHLQGDECLRQAAACIAGQLHRSGDLAARIGGEEFAVLLPGTDAAGAVRVAESIRAAFAADHARPFHAAGAITVSIGAACVRPDGAAGAERLLQAADQALYRAKHAGRNRVILA